LTEIAEIVAALEPQLGDLRGDPAPLDGGITNRNYRANLGGCEYVIRLPGKDTDQLGIDRGAERSANESAAALGVAPPVAAMLTDPACLVTGFVEGEQMSAADLREPQALAEVARSLRLVHDSGATVPTSFDSFRLVEQYAQTAAARGVSVPPDYEEARAHARAIEAALDGPEHQPVLCHNDLLAGNFLRGTQIWIVDWEYAGMGDRYFDLANFAVNNELDEAQQIALLDDYWRDRGPAISLADLRLMVFMSDFREAMWGVVQQGISDLDFDFADYAAKHFARLRETAADPSFAGWLTEARADAAG
jgi:thiamine kinase-like enzyme